MGLRTQQYQLLQCVGGMPEGIAPTIANVAARMLLKHNSAVELVDRSVEQGLLRRSGDDADHRRILLRVTPQGERILASLSEFHTRELEQSGPELVRALDRILHVRKARPANAQTKGGSAMSSAEHLAKSQPKSLSHSQLGDFNAGPRMIMLSGLGLILGGAGAALAWILLHLIYACTNLFYYQRWSWTFASPAQNQLHWLALFVPVVGGLIVGLMARYGSDKIRGHGIPEALESILIHGARISPRVALFKPLGSAVAIGTGGPFGAEGPIIMTAGSVGSLLGQFFHLTDAERSTLLVAGAAAGMAGVFSTPLAAILLAVELLLFEWRPRSFVPVAVAAITAGVLRRFFLSAGPLFAMPGMTGEMQPAALAGALLLGVAGGVLAMILSRAVYASEDFFEHHLPIHWMWWPAIGGVVVGVGGLIFPRALGTGYDVIDSLLAGNRTWQLIAGILIVKSIIWSFSLGSGTSGGIMAPLLMIGGALGALFTPILPSMSTGAWALVGMTAVFSGAIGCPLTAAVLSPRAHA